LRRPALIGLAAAIGRVAGVIPTGADGSSALEAEEVGVATRPRKRTSKRRLFRIRYPEAKAPYFQDDPEVSNV
jgi:hypothetical protein